MNFEGLDKIDPPLFAAIKKEERRQEDHIELIASENYVSPQVMAVQGSVLTNKYAEGYPGKRYYGGCEFVDIAEELAIITNEATRRREEIQPHLTAARRPHIGKLGLAFGKLANDRTRIRLVDIDAKRLPHD